MGIGVGVNVVRYMLIKIDDHQSLKYRNDHLNDTKLNSY